MTSIMQVFILFPVIMSLCDHLSVCVFLLGKKLTRQEDQKLFLTLFCQMSFANFDFIIFLVWQQGVKEDQVVLI